MYLFTQSKSKEKKIQVIIVAIVRIADDFGLHESGMDRAGDSAGDVDGAILVHNIPVSIQGHNTRRD